MTLLSFANLNVADAEALDQIDAAAEAGFDAVGLCIHPPERLQASLVRDVALRRKVKSRLAELNMRVLDIEIFTLLPDTNFTTMAPAFEAAADLGAQFVLAMGNDPDEKRACDNFGNFADLAASFNLKAMLEFISFRPLRDIRQADRWLRRLNHPAAGMCIDALHLFRSGGTIADVKALDPKEIGYLQICDAASMDTAEAFSEAELLHEARMNRRLPGEGLLPLKALIDAMPAGTPISFEAPRIEYAHLTVAERAAKAMVATRTLISKTA